MKYKITNLPDLVILFYSLVRQKITGLPMGILYYLILDILDKSYNSLYSFDKLNISVFILQLGIIRF